MLYPIELRVLAHETFWAFRSKSRVCMRAVKAKPLTFSGPLPWNYGVDFRNFRGCKAAGKECDNTCQPKESERNRNLEFDSKREASVGVQRGVRRDLRGLAVDAVLLGDHQDRLSEAG